jgi:cell division protein ZapE
MTAAPPHDDAGGPLAGWLARRVAAGEIASDAAQKILVARLDSLLRDLRDAQRPGVIARLFGRQQPGTKGLYIYGEVGRGKTMLMDGFFALAPVAAKRRIHFNEFMGDVHDRIHVFRQGPDGAGDPIAPVAARIAEETRLLCLDEFSVTDIADAMILSRLFSALFDQGTGRGLVLVATSNTAPEDLYRDGLNRGLFLPFLDILREHVDVVRLDVAIDYRLAKLAGTPVYVTPLGRLAREALDRLWRSLTGVPQGQPTALRTRGRDIRIPQAEDGVARFTFADLCEAPLAANDYVQIARAFHTVFVDDIPIIADAQRNAARRFILLVDTFYDHHVRLIASAAAEPDALYAASDGEEAFAFRRTVSRLIEMRSGAYLGAAHGGAAAAAEEHLPLAPQHQSG